MSGLIANLNEILIHSSLQYFYTELSIETASVLLDAETQTMSANKCRMLFFNVADRDNSDPSIAYPGEQLRQSKASCPPVVLRNFPMGHGLRLVDSDWTGHQYPSGQGTGSLVPCTQ